MKAQLSRQRSLDIVGHGARLNRLAFTHTGDVNEGNLLVHGVIARVLSDDRLASTAPDLDAALLHAIGAASDRRAMGGV